jgi:3-oxoadipate enol-lactonase
VEPFVRRVCRMTLSHDVAGAGPAVVLLHAGVCDRGMWDAQWSALADAGYRLVRCDLRGFGRTPAPDRPHSDADDVLELLDALGLARAALVGASYGGRVALEVAARRPERVSALALLCSAWPGHESSPELAAVGARENELIAAGDIDGALTLMVDTWLGPDADASARAAVRRMQRRAYDVQLAAREFEPVGSEVDLAAVKAPCLAVSGAHDLPDFRHTAAHLPGARHLELPWSGHLPTLERPRAATALLRAFLDDHVPAG